MQDINELLHERVKKILRAKGKTQKDLAQALGITPATLNGALKTGNPELKTLVGISKALGIDLYELFISDEKLKALKALEGLSKK